MFCFFDHNEFHMLFLFHAPGSRPQLQHVETARIIEVDGRLQQDRGRLREPAMRTRRHIPARKRKRGHLGMRA